MALVWQYGEKSGYESWKGLSWGMVSFNSLAEQLINCGFVVIENLSKHLCGAYIVGLLLENDLYVTNFTTNLEKNLDYD